MKIAIFCDSFFPTIDGVVISIKNAITLLSKKNKIYVFIPSGSKELKLKNVEYFQLKSNQLKSYKEYRARTPSFVEVYKKLKKIKPDIVHVHSIFGIGWEGLVASKLLNIPVLVTSHTIFSEVTGELNLGGIEKTKFFEKISWKYMMFFLNKCNAIITPSKAMKKELLKHKAKRHIEVISNGIDTEKFLSIKRKNKKNPIIIYVGRLVQSKHVDVILKAFNIVTQKGINSNLWIVGTGPEEEKLKKYAYENNISKNVKFFGFIDNNKLSKIYKKADIFATASTIETEGITTLEAMLAGLPIIGVDARATPLLVTKEIGFISQPGDEKQISEFMIRLIKDYKLRLKLGKNASKKAKKYDLNKVNKQLYEFYNKIIEENLKK